MISQSWAHRRLAPAMPSPSVRWQSSQAYAPFAVVRQFAEGVSHRERVGLAAYRSAFGKERSSWQFLQQPPERRPNRSPSREKEANPAAPGNAVSTFSGFRRAHQASVSIPVPGVSCSRDVGILVDCPFLATVIERHRGVPTYERCPVSLRYLGRRFRGISAEMDSSV